MRIVYSPVDAVRLAEANPDRQVVFFAVGFETTAPANGMAVVEAKQRGVENFSALVSHVRVPPAVRAILDEPECRVQGFLAPGHVCAIMGTAEYEELAREYGVPFVVAGFEPLDLVHGIARLADMLAAGEAPSTTPTPAPPLPGATRPRNACWPRSTRSPTSRGAASAPFPRAVCA